MRIADAAKHHRELEIYAKRIKRASEYNIRVSNYASLMIDALTEGVENRIVGRFELGKIVQTVERAARSGMLTDAEDALNGLAGVLSSAASQKSLPPIFIDHLLYTLEEMFRQGGMVAAQFDKVEAANSAIARLRPSGVEEMYKRITEPKP